MPAFEAVAETLAGLSVDVAFGLLGSGNLRVAERLSSRHGVVHYWARHGCSAISMADGWARACDRVGVCSVHQGPGLTQALPGMVEAAKAHTPLLVLAGDVASTAVSVNQRVDQDALVLATGAGAERIQRGSTAVRDVLRAWRRAVQERRPIVVSFPVDVQTEPCDRPIGVLPPATPPPAVPAGDALEPVVGLIESAKRPVVLGGRGAVRAAAREPLRELAARAGALLATTAPALGLFAGDPWSIGVAGGFSSPRAQALLPQADLVLAFGAGLNAWTTKHGELITDGATVVSCDDEPSLLGAHRRPDVALVGDARQTALALCAALDERGVRLPGFRHEVGGADLADDGWRIEDASRPGTVDPRMIMRVLDERLPPARNLVTDSGRYIGWAPMHLSVTDAPSFIFSQSFMSLGLGLATGIGAALARPDRITVAVVGDGGLMMSLGELDTAVSHGVPLLVVVMDDGAAGAEVHHFRSLGEPTSLVDFGTRDFAGVARALGARSATVARMEDLRALDDWIAEPHGTFVLDCKIDGDIVPAWLEEAFRAGP